MHIAGGIYRELCLRPAWNGLFGSGGRAALCLAALSTKPVLHAYMEEGGQGGLEAFVDQGIDMRLAPRAAAIAFAYFHPLSRPHLEPASIEPCDPILVSGDTVLRFGFLEGSAVVHARRAVFDPQGWRDPLDFEANGSKADELALVLNDDELRQTTGAASAVEAARDVLRSGRASVVVVKRGFRGALVVDRSLRVDEVPAYRSDRIFKIGTGDVFSARFAFHWGEERCKPVDAARRASAAVAAYAASQEFSAEVEPAKALAVGGEPHGPVAVLGATDTVGNYYVREEAIFRLRELGVDARAWSSAVSFDRAAAALVLADGLHADEVRDIVDRARGTPVVALRERPDRAPLTSSPDMHETDDFTTAIYRAAWAASALSSL